MDILVANDEQQLSIHPLKPQIATIAFLGQGPSTIFDATFLSEYIRLDNLFVFNTTVRGSFVHDHLKLIQFVACEFEQNCTAPSTIKTETEQNSVSAKMFFNRVKSQKLTAMKLLQTISKLNLLQIVQKIQITCGFYSRTACSEGELKAALQGTQMSPDEQKQIYDACKYLKLSFKDVVNQVAQEESQVKTQTIIDFCKARQLTFDDLMKGMNQVKIIVGFDKAIIIAKYSQIIEMNIQNLISILQKYKTSNADLAGILSVFCSIHKIEFNQLMKEVESAEITLGKLKLVIIKLFLKANKADLIEVYQYISNIDVFDDERVDLLAFYRKVSKIQWTDMQRKLASQGVQKDYMDRIDAQFLK